MLRYITIALKHPKAIKNLIYKNYLGIILNYDISKENFIALNELNNYHVKKSKSIDQIFNFYRHMGRTSVTKSSITKWINEGYECFLIYDNKIVIGGTWIFKNEFNLLQVSGRILSVNKTIKLNKDVLYKCYTIIDSDYRGKGLNQLLIKELLKNYSNSNYNKIIAITGASNGGYIRSTMKCGGTLIGIVQVRNIFGVIRRKEIFIDTKEKSWQ